MSWRRPPTVWALGMLAVVTLAGSLAALVALQSGEARVGPARLVALAPGYDRRADGIVTRSPITMTEAAIAADLSREALAQWPYDTESRLRLAWLEAPLPGPISPSGASALRRSYDLIAVDRDSGKLRIHQALEHWQALDPQLRRMVENETKTLWRIPAFRERLRQVAAATENGPGRLQLLLWIIQLDAESQAAGTGSTGGTAAMGLRTN